MPWMKWLAAAFVLLAIAAVALTAYGNARWSGLTNQLNARLEASRTPAQPARYGARELDGLPAPVQRFFRAVLTDGMPIVSAAGIEHRGTFNMGEAADNWKPFTSTQRVVTRRPGFVWDGRITMMPGLAVRVHDAYVGGEGILHATLLGLFKLADLRGTPDVAQGELMRFFAEAAWVPTALLPSQGVRWEPVDEQSARATMVDGPVSVTLTFRFDEQGLMTGCRAEARGRTVGTAVVPTPWEGRFSGHQQRDGMRVPMTGEVAWLLPEGRKPYWRGEITALRYEFAP
jgi:hypothetical protein